MDVRGLVLAGVGGGVSAGLVSAGLLAIGPGDVILDRQAALYVGDPSLLDRIAVHLVHSTFLAFVFVGFARRFVNQYVATMLALNRRSARLRRASMPAIERAGFGFLVVTGMGMVFGMIVWVGIGIGAFARSDPLGLGQLLASLLSTLVWGLLLGVSYDRYLL